MPTTRELILTTAQALAQTRGYCGFSYADIGAELAITNASIHYHFPSKALLADALVARYRENFDDARRPYEDLTLSARERLHGYAGLYAEVFSDGGRMCLCGVFAADAASLPATARRATAAFFDDQQLWVAAAFLAAGHTTDQARKAAHAYLAALEGALLLARATAFPHARARPNRATGPDRAKWSAVADVAATLLDALLPLDLSAEPPGATAP